MLLRAAATAARLCLLALVLAALQSFAHVTWVPPWLQIAVAVVPGLLTLWRPLEGLQFVAAFIPLVGGHRPAVRHAGVCRSRKRWRSPRLPARSRDRCGPPLEAPLRPRAPLWLFGLTIAAVARGRASPCCRCRPMPPAAFIRSFAHWLTHDTSPALPHRHRRGAAPRGARALLDRRGGLCRRPDATVRLLRMIVLGASAAALLNMYRLAVSALRSPLRSTPRGSSSAACA